MGGKGDDRAMALRIGAQILRDQPRPDRAGLVVAAAKDSAPKRRGLVEGLAGGFLDQRLLRGKMLVEAAHRHLYRRHDVGDRDRLDPAFAKQPAGALDDPCPVLQRLFGR